MKTTVYRSKLQRRLIRLEKRLKLSSDDCHTSDAKLASAKEVSFVAIRRRHRAASLKLDRIGRNKSRTPTPRPNHGLEHYYKATTTPVKSEAGENRVPTQALESPVRLPLNRVVIVLTFIIMTEGKTKRQDNMGWS